MIEDPEVVPITRSKRKKIFSSSARRSASFLRRLGRLIDDERKKEKRNSGAEAIKKTDIRCKCYLAGRLVAGDKSETGRVDVKNLDDESGGRAVLVVVGRLFSM